MGRRLFRLPFGVLADGFVLAYALWTIAANLVVIAGGTTGALIAAAVLVLAALIGLIALALARPCSCSRTSRMSRPSPCSLRANLRARVDRHARGAGADVARGWSPVTPGSRGAGSADHGVCAADRAARAVRVEPVAPRAHLDRARARRAVRAGAVLRAVHRARGAAARDDTFYLNMAVAVVDYPHQALLSLNNLHGPASDTLALQKMFAPYRVHSFEVLGGLISRLTGIEAVRVIHLGLAPLFGWLAPFAIARLLRLLAPRDWLIALLAVVIFYCIEGTASRGYANHAFVRMFNGKSALLTLAVPLICAHGLRFGARPSMRALAMLALAQITAVGLSSTALWLAPTLAMIAVAAGTPSLRRCRCGFRAASSAPRTCSRSRCG